ncbi:MAG: cytochrome c, partial [Acidobacteriota bacterium]|nr:cytochrome c [Acidobacteriota bacterium]
LLTFALNGKSSLPEPLQPDSLPLTPIPSTAARETIAAGAVFFAQHCAVCHGIAATGGGGVLPDLRQIPPEQFNRFRKIVLDGSLAGAGMPSFKQWLTPEEVDAIRAYIIDRRVELTRQK